MLLYNVKNGLNHIKVRCIFPGSIFDDNDDQSETYELGAVFHRNYYQFSKGAK